MLTSIKRAFVPLRYRITHTTKFPKGDLLSTLYNFSRRGFQPACIVDVGANRGKWSQNAMLVYPDAEYLMLEPQAEMQPHLDRLCRKAKEARWMQMGAADQNGELSFTVAPDTVSSTFGMSPEAARLSGMEQRRIPVRTLDDLVQKELGRIPELVKIDAEGFEMKIIDGASTLLGQTEAIFMEAHLLSEQDDPCNFANMVTRMADHGYEPYDFTWFGKRPSDGAVSLCEIVFVRRDGVLRQQLGWVSAA